MNEKHTVIILGGMLGKTFGRKHKRFVSSANEAVRALCCTIKGFEAFLNNSKKRGLTFAVYKDDKNIGVDDLSFPVSGNVIKILPVIIGSKKAGLLQTILGAVIVAAAVLAGPLGVGAITAGTAWNIGALGVSLAFGGVIQLLSPQPGGIASKQDPDNRASYAFGGVTNTAAQGYPVPLLYGQRRIGGAIISAGIYVEDQQ